MKLSDPAIAPSAPVVPRGESAHLARVSAERDAARAQATSAERGRAEAERRLEKQRHELETAHRWLDAHLSREAPSEAKAPKAGVTQWRGRIEDDNGDGSVIARMWKISDCAEFLITLPSAVLRGQKWRPGSAVDLWEWLPDGAWCIVDAEADELNLLRVRCNMLRAEVERLSTPQVARGLSLTITLRDGDQHTARLCCVACGEQGCELEFQLGGLDGRGFSTRTEAKGLHRRCLNAAAPDARHGG